MNIVVVEDVPMVRERIVDALLELPGVFVVGEADSVATALVSIESNRPDVVLLDMSLPGTPRITNGIGVLKWIKQTHPAIYIVMLTNHAGHAYREACEAAGAFAFLDKSYEFDRLSAVIAQLHNDLTSRPKSRSIPVQSVHQTQAGNQFIDQINQLDRPIQNLWRFVLWMHFMLAIFSYIRLRQSENRKEQTWRGNWLFPFC